MLSTMADTRDVKDIKQSLRNLGLDELEIKVYLASLTEDSRSILALSRETKIPRTSVYRAADDLVNKNFAHWVIKDKSKHLRAVKPDSLGFLLEDKREQLESTKNSLYSLQMMASQITKNVPQTQVRYYKGKEGMKQLIWNTLDAEEEIIGYSQFGRKVVVGDKFYDSYVAEFKKRDIRDRAIGNENALKYVRGYVLTEKHQQTTDDVRIVPTTKFYVSGDNSMYNNIYAVSYWDKGEIVGIEIENAELVKLHTSIFELMWEIAKPVNEYL